jgi:hypothetical protein
MHVHVHNSRPRKSALAAALITIPVQSQLKLFVRLAILDTQQLDIEDQSRAARDYRWEPTLTYSDHCIKHEEGKQTLKTTHHMRGRKG